jgi:hypothetical protein
MSVEAKIQGSDNWFIGEDRTLRFAVVDSDGVAQDISGWSLEWVLRRSPAGGTANITKTDGDGISITDGAGGILQVTISDQDTIDLGPASYFHTLRRDDDGNEIVLSFGQAILKSAATR